ncbi:hypothetical protein BBK14_29640 [Parafrankia soli]|uniref:HTH lacI-type domain-containing protein n=1 Tax=Parafrankia soli TaxID=2599596 RepID=A0A1S1PEC1_9ACTN|nr:LacI family DNA-binding transcriptional regulator [Parafrankia soli]ABW09912.1 transcriptional regulator, LacI family [Frankia sp. EAN1pec]OHV18912.1 hypothetical protein BBK14_29640 [Parafrankia soli]
MGTRPRGVTASDVARALGVSRVTVSYVLNQTPGQSISEATRKKVLAEAERLGYRPHAAARSLAGGSSRVILFLLPDWPVGDHTTGEYLKGAANVLNAAGYTLTAGTHQTGSQARPLWEALDADLVVPVAPLTDEELAALRPASAPRALAGGALAPEQSPISRIGTALQVQHLHELGHTRLVFAGSSDPRLAGLVAARAAEVRERGRELGIEVIDEQLIADTDDGVAAVVQGWLAAAVTGVVAFNDNVAAHVVRAAVRGGVPVPERLAVVGHDDSPLARLYLPTLTSVRVDAAGMGRRTARAVLHTLGVEKEPPGPADINATLIRRETT